MGDVISGLAEFKTELLQLHAMVKEGKGEERREGGGGEGGCVKGEDAVFYNVYFVHSPSQLLRNTNGAEVSPTHEGGGGEQDAPARGKPPSVLTLTTSTASTTSTALLKKEEEVRAAWLLWERTPANADEFNLSYFPFTLVPDRFSP